MIYDLKDFEKRLEQFPLIRDWKPKYELMTFVIARSRLTKTVTEVDGNGMIGSATQARQLPAIGKMQNLPSHYTIAREGNRITLALIVGMPDTNGNYELSPCLFNYGVLTVNTEAEFDKARFLWFSPFHKHPDNPYYHSESPDADDFIFEDAELIRSEQIDSEALVNELVAYIYSSDYKEVLEPLATVFGLSTSITEKELKVELTNLAKKNPTLFKSKAGVSTSSSEEKTPKVSAKKLKDSGAV